MEMFPIFFKLEGRACLVVGAGTIAAPKIASLLRAGGAVTVVAPRANSAIAAQAETGEVLWHAREFVPGDLNGMFLAIAATDLQPVNHTVAEEARARGILVNSVDDPPDCDFFYPSVVRRGDLQIAISTAGKSPALAQRLREEIAALLPLGEDRKQALHLLARRETCVPEECPVQRTLNRMLASKAGDAQR